jgi:hypothetical protein
MKSPLFPRVSSQLFRWCVTGVGAALAGAALHAVPLQIGDVTGAFDTTLSFGGIYRLQNPVPDFFGVANTFRGVPGRQNSVNTDDGNLNYPRGLSSELFKGSHELELHYQDLGLLVRGYWFSDRISDQTARTPLSNRAQRRVVKGGEWLDMYGRFKFTLGERTPVDLRIGRQVLSLGESTFLPNGINVVNPVDLSKLRNPGAELKEAFLPVNMVKASIGLTENLTIEPFWLLEFRRNELEPAGTLFSTNDFASPGGSQVWLGTGALSDLGTLGNISRGDDRSASNTGQYGLAVRWLAPQLNNTELGFYYARYSSRSPVISTRTPTAGINTNLTGPLTIAFVQGGLPAATAATQAAFVFGAIVKSQTAPATLTPTEIATLQSASVQSAIAGARRIALLQAAASGRYFTEYPEDITMTGVSFNTALGKTGISWQGEVSYKQDVPLQVDDAELLFATVSSLTNSAGAAFGSNNQVGNFLGQYSTEIPGYRRHKVWTAQSTLTKVFGPMLGSQQFTLVGEAGGVWVNLPSKSTLRYDGSGTFTSGDQAALNNTGTPTLLATPESAFADSFSWGYQILARLDYNNVFPNVNLQPSIAFTHDVSGNTPFPLGNYIRGRKSLNLAVEFTYRNAWSFELRYVNFSGAGVYNLLSDRDYVATTVKYSF